jgi:hypothetical protein
MTARIAGARGTAAWLLAAAWLGGCDAPRTSANDEAAVAAGPAPMTTTPATPPPTTAGATDPGFVALDATVVATADTLATLRARLGAGSVVAGKVPGAEGEEFDGWILFPDDPARTAFVYLDDAGRPASVRVIDDEGRSRWRRADGIHIGTTLDELVALNGKPVKFMGFDWDYGGGITGWNGGALEREPPLGGVTLCASCPTPGDACYPLGDAEFDSATAPLDRARIVVCDFDVNLDPAGAMDAEAP